MSEDNEDLEDINFDSDWEYCYVEETTINPSFLSHKKNHSEWLSVSLPHIIDEDSKINNSLNYCYRKKFHWNLSEEIPEEQIYLVFESTDNEDRSSINATIWFNGKEICTNSSLSQLKTIELTSNLIKLKEKNLLIISCGNQSLSLHIRLIIYRKTNLTLEKSSIDNENKNIDCTFQFNKTDGRINICFENLKQKVNARLSSSSSSIPSKNNSLQPLCDEKSIDKEKIPHLQIVILIVGTRGDVQPFIALGQKLISYGHRVRIATHESFRSFVRENGLEFYPLSGDPAELMTFMVKNDGIIPSLSSIVAGDISKHRRILSSILTSTWSACIADDDETSMRFTAEAIIANPPSFGHIHCAEKLQIPLHIMFTMPWSPTSLFPHPLCNIDQSKESKEKINLYSYHIVEMLTWSGMHHIINEFRKKTLGLPSLRTYEATNLLHDHRVPHTYCWSTSLVPKPSDWESHIHVSGFFFLNLANNYTNPPKDLVDFINDNKNSSLIYIGFGSITGHDRSHLLQVVIEALEKTGYRALLSNLANDSDHLPSNVFKIGNVPHDWVFQYVSAVCHHGGAGTTAAGLRAGKPTIVVPFFGDQFFWGNIIEKSGAGPRPVPGKSITADELADAFRIAHQPSAQIAAENIRLAMEKEDGCESAVRAFHSHLPLDLMRSDLESTYAACYRIDKLNIQISRPIAYVLVSAGLIDVPELKSHHTQLWKLNHDHPFHYIKHRKSSLSNIKVKRIQTDDNTNLSINEQDDIDNNSYQDQFTPNHNKTDRIYSFDDLYSESNKSNENDFHELKSLSKTGKRALWKTKKINVVNFLHRLRSDHQEHHKTCNTTAALIATSSYAIKSTIGTFPSTTNLGQPMNIIEQTILNSNNKQISSHPEILQTQTSSSIINDQQHQKDNDNIPTNIQIASVVSGFPIETCQQILLQFNQIKQKQTSDSLLRVKTSSNPKFQRQRSHSTSAID